MVDTLPNFEQKDREGSTTLFTGTATTTATDFPSVAGNCIAEFFIENMSTEDDDDDKYNIEFSWDGGTTYKTLKPGRFIGWSIKGNVQQIKIRRGSTEDVPFELILNRDLD